MLERHAVRILEQLRREQQDLDARESEFHARVAQLEAELRGVRLELAERDEELTLRERALDAQARQLSEQAADIAAAERALPGRRREAARHQDRTLRESLEQAIATWRERVQGLEAQDRQLQAQFADLAADRRRLSAERAALAKERDDQRMAVAAEQERMRGLAETRSQELADRSARLDRRQQAVQQMHLDLSRLYREAIETQLCTEELWHEMHGSSLTAEATARLATLRKKLADEYQLSEQYLRDQLHQIRETTEQMTQESHAIQQQRHELREWHYRRQQEMERDARQLQQRDCELCKKENDLRLVELQWDQQRRTFEQEIRRLRRLVHEGA
jgi:hypothetical protein